MRLDWIGLDFRFFIDTASPRDSLPADQEGLQSWSAGPDMARTMYDCSHGSEWIVGARTGGEEVRIELEVDGTDRARSNA